MIIIVFVCVNQYQSSVMNIDVNVNISKSINSFIYLIFNLIKIIIIIIQDNEVINNDEQPIRFRY